MIGNFDTCLRPVLQWEGGNDDDPQDPGGRTSRGILQSEYTAYRVRAGLSKNGDVWHAADSDIRTIYWNNYWLKYDCEYLPAGIDLTMFDSCVNTGTRPIRWLQRAVGTTPDGALGPATLAAAKHVDPKHVILEMMAERRMFYLGLHKSRFIKGWLGRTADIQRLALGMVR